MAERLAVHVLTHDSLRYLPACLSGISRQEHCPDRILFIDCASTDGTVEWLKSHQADDPPFDLLLLPDNRGYAGGHNAGLRTGDEEFVQLLNPDVRLQPAFLGEALKTLERHGRAGAVTGKLLRADSSLHPLPGPVLDSTGIIMTRSQRHLDRGAGQPDRGQYDTEEEVFGASGAAPLYRRAMLQDVAVLGEVFDEIFFAYREDADLAWRARLLGWSAFYTPRACAAHRRRVRPGNRRTLPPEINRFSVRNRFLLRIKNQTASNLFRTLFPALLRDLEVIGYVLLRERSSLPGLVDVLRALRKTLAKRHQIMSRRCASAWDVDRWFRPAPSA
ncbi:MAG: glycosyltransferase family 2 protein [Acidobacteriota bacterium]